MVRRLFFALTILMILVPWADAGLVSFSGISQSGNGPGDPPAPYGPPTILGNWLSFKSPFAFSATSANGVFDLEDSFTDGLLSFSVEADANTWITKMSLKERGGRNLLELIPLSGSAATRVRVLILAGKINVTELDHGNTPLTPAAAADIPIGFDVTWDLVNFPDPNAWTVSTMRNIENILINRGVSFELGATAFDFEMNNQLFAISEEGTFAYIDKKRIDIHVDTEMIIPEPMTVVLAMSCMGLVILSASAARKF